MDKEQILLFMEGLEIEPEKIDEFMAMYEQESATQTISNKEKTRAEVEFALRSLLHSSQVDWREKARIAAQIISNNLED